VLKTGTDTGAATGGENRSSLQRASLDQIAQRQISKLAMARRKSTALNITNTLDAIKERQVQ